MNQSQATSSASKAVIGIVGGIGSGKSAVAAEFAKLGCAVISADQLNHQVLQKKDVIEQIVQSFGPAVLKPDGLIDRAKLGDIVFNNPDQLAKLTGLTHPIIADLQAQLMQQYQNNPQYKAIVLDIPLLFETGQNRLCSAIIFVDSDANIRLQRVINRGWTAEKMKNAENLQITLDMKAKMSDYSIANNSCILSMAMQVKAIFSLLIGSK